VSPKPERQQSLAEVALRRAGFIEARRGLLYLAAWGAVADELQRPFTIEEYSVWWKQSSKTSYRERAAFVKCFPGVEVADLWALVRDRVMSRGPAASLEVGGVPAPGLVLA
jgi:hypothetical protein